MINKPKISKENLSPTSTNEAFNNCMQPANPTQRSEKKKKKTYDIAI